MARAAFTSFLLWLAALSAGCECGKVNVTDLGASFSLADASWFEVEQTLFFFYRVDALQGINDASLIEIAYRTDTETVPFTPLDQFTPVHTHLPVDCGPNARCGSISVHVADEPRVVQLRLRYHRDGALSAHAQTNLNLIKNALLPNLSRSLVVYGVFDQLNQHVQWRARHVFPTIRNETAEQYGLRRYFRVTDAAYGDGPPLVLGEYGYGVVPCTGTTPLGWPMRETTDRAFFEPTELPLAASSLPAVCGTATVTDATGTFSAVAVARKNPQTQAAFPILRTPIRVIAPLKFVIRPCRRSIDEQHLAMQRQRLLVGPEADLCVEDPNEPGLADRLAATFTQAAEAQRPIGIDMTLMLAVHSDDRTGVLNRAIESALSSVLVPEQNRSTPRLAGAFVFDSSAYGLTRPELAPLVLWCPARLPATDDLDSIASAAQRDCPLLPTMPDFMLGPFRINQLPILPSRAQYTTFVQKYSEAQAGKVVASSIVGPQRSAVSDNIISMGFLVVTRFNNELITADQDDAFSYCPAETSADYVSRVVLQPYLGPIEQMMIFTPLSAFPQLHEQLKWPAYALGLGWESPFIIRFDYEAQLAVSATVASVTLPFGIASSNSQFVGNRAWEQGEFPLTGLDGGAGLPTVDVLTQCTRFCTHPTFDSAGVYQVLNPFNPTYLGQCYRPRFPFVGEGGFPIDP